MQKSAIIEYKDDRYLCEGFAVWDDADAKRPGILVLTVIDGSGAADSVMVRLDDGTAATASVLPIHAACSPQPCARP
jgi:hypothetical protein